MISKRTLILIGLITFFGFLLRFLSLDQYPSGFHRDEAFLGYNAYSFLMTARDMNGELLPIHLKSFLYTPAGYSYFSIPFVWLFGLNEFSVRFASALFGALSVPLLGIVVHEISKRSSALYFHKKANSIGLFSAFFLAISPWHIQLSRTASVSTLVTFFILLGFYFFLISLKKNNKVLLLLTYASFVVSLFFYIAPYSFIPLFIPLIIFLYKMGKEKKKRLFWHLAGYGAILILALYTFISPNLSLRASSLNIMSSDELVLKIEEMHREDGVLEITPLQARFFHNKATGGLEEFLKNYAEHLSFGFLFQDAGFPNRLIVPHVGLLYYIEILLICLGVMLIAKNDKKILALLIGWILIGPLGSAFASDEVPNFQRTLYFLPGIIIFSAAGGVVLIEKASGRVIWKIVTFGVFSALFYQFMFNYHQYVVHGNRYRPWYRNDGYKDLVAKTKIFEKDYRKIVITTRESAPTIFFLFYNSYDPKKFHKEIRDKNFKDIDRVDFGKYIFSTEECPLRIDEFGKSTGEKNALYVNSSLCPLTHDDILIDTVRRSDDSEVFRIVKLRNE